MRTPKHLRRFHPDKRLWERVHLQSEMPEMALEIYSNTKNDGGNSDTYLVGIHSEPQPFRIAVDPEQYNTLDYHFRDLAEQEWIWFLVVGHWEIALLVDAFKSAAPKFNTHFQSPFEDQ